MPIVQIDANPHPGQAEVHHDPARFKVLACGRRWGKTRLGVNECLDVAAQGGRAWWVAPTYKMSEVAWRPLRRIASQAGAELRKVERQAIFPGGGWVAVRSADNPDSLRGEGLDFIVMDECAYIRERAWTEALRPALSDRLGRGMFISTPAGRNWFWRMYQRAATDDEWAAWSFPTSANPYIEAGEIEAARATLPEQTFRQEYLAEFVEDAGLVFRNLRACIGIPPAQADPNRRYVMGVDWAQQKDFTVLTVMDSATAQVCEIDRFNQIGWDVQRGRLAALAEKWDVGHILAEANSIGGPNIEQLQSEGLPVRGFTTTNQSKQEIVVALQLAFEREQIIIPDDDTLLAELESFEAERTPSGKWQYRAAEGFHDDMVISLALAYEAANRPATMKRLTTNLYGSRGRAEKGKRNGNRNRR